MRGKRFQYIAVLGLSLALATVYNSCGNPIGEVITGISASSIIDNDGVCFTLPTNKVSPSGKLSLVSDGRSPASVSPFANRKVFHNETQNDYVALVSHNCLRSADNRARAGFTSSFASAMSDSEIDLWPHRFNWDGEAAKRSDLVGTMNSDPCLIGVSPNVKYTLTARQGEPVVINDPFVTNQNHLPALFFDQYLDLYYNWNTIIDEANPIKVAVIDTGAFYEHPDLAANMYEGLNGIGVDATTLGINGIDPVYDGTEVDFVSTHGTHVSGIIAAVGANGQGVTGLAPRGVKIVPINVFYPVDQQGNVASDTVTITRGVLWAITQGVDVINMSLGGPAPDPAFLAALQQAISANIFIAVAAGNATLDVPAQELSANFAIYPASYAAQLNGMVAVGSVDSQSMTRSSFSHYGVNSVEISSFGAEGVGGIMSTIGTNNYGRLRGTSQASPQVAAAAAMIMGLYRSGLNSKPTPAQVENLLLQTARKVPALATSFRDGNLLDIRQAAIQVYSQNRAAFDACP